MLLCQDPTAAVRSALAKQMGHVVCALWSFQQTKQDSSPRQVADSDTEDTSEQLAISIGEMSIQQTEDNQQHQKTDMQAEVVRLVHTLATQDAFQLRQQFVEVCYHIACCEVQTSIFRTYFMSAMLSLAQDQVANVRLALARALNLLHTSKLADVPEVLSTLDMLAHDEDSDVASCVTQHQPHKVEPDI